MVLNPVRAAMVKDAQDWPWSSYLPMIRQTYRPNWLQTAWILAQFSLDERRAILLYQDFVRAGVGLPSLWAKQEHPVVLGSETFIEKI